MPPPSLIVKPKTLDTSFSFYVHTADPIAVRESAMAADAVIVRGQEGPALVRAIRLAGWEGTALFDLAGYEDRSNEAPSRWFDMQREAGADRVLTPGCFVDWTKAPSQFMSLAGNELALAASQPDATALVAIDYRWLSKGLYEAVEGLRKAGTPVALVLADNADPLARSQAVGGLIAMLSKVPSLSVLRSDHGAIGALAFGAAHASIGLRATYRHFVPPKSSASAIPNDRTPRIFIREMMDWFSGSNIAGWATTSVQMACQCPTCKGASLARFLDTSLKREADSHNIAVLAELANDVLGAPANERRRYFGRLCKDALEHYGPMGKLSMVTKPKPQLEQWALYA